MAQQCRFLYLSLPPVRHHYGPAIESSGPQERAKGYRTYSGQVSPPSVLLRAQEQQYSRSELAVRLQVQCISALAFTIIQEATGQSRLEQCVPQSKMERTSSNPTLPTMALGRCRSKPKQSSAGGLDMHAGLCSSSTQCGTVWPGLVHGRGEPIAPKLDRGRRYNPTLRWSMWVPQILVNQPHWQLLSGGACSSPGQSRLFVCWLSSGDTST